VIRLATMMTLVLLAACADRSKGSALNACRTRYYLDAPTAEAQLIPACMNAASFEIVPQCEPASDEQTWDWQVQSSAFDNPRCYQPIGPVPWIETVLSPM
jgi:hypothetical protein